MTTLVVLLVIAIAIMAAKNLLGPKKYEKYKHHGAEVWVRSDLKGKHRDYCLCWSCNQFHPGQKINCPAAQVLYQNCVTFDVVTPVWECPNFERITQK